MWSDMLLFLSASIFSNFYVVCLSWSDKLMLQFEVVSKLWTSWFIQTKPSWGLCWFIQTKPSWGLWGSGNWQLHQGQHSFIQGFFWSWSSQLRGSWTGKVTADLDGPPVGGRWLRSHGAPPTHRLSESWSPQSSCPLWWFSVSRSWCRGPSFLISVVNKNKHERKGKRPQVFVVDYSEECRSRGVWGSHVFIDLVQICRDSGPLTALTGSGEILDEDPPTRRHFLSWTTETRSTEALNFKHESSGRFTPLLDKSTRTTLPSLWRNWCLSGWWRL